MATPLVSPGVLVREVDLTVGRAGNISASIGAIAGPFAKGPVNEITRVNTEQDLVNIFGTPSSTDGQYEYWLSASSFLSYGGTLNVVRCGNSTLANANAGFGTTMSSPSYVSGLQIFNADAYQANYAESTGGFAFAARDPGTWGESLKVAFIDNKADQRITIASTPTSALVGTAVSVTVSSQQYVTAAGVVTTFTGDIKGIVAGINSTTKTIDVKIVSRRATGATADEAILYQEGIRVLGFAASDSIASVGGTLTASSVDDWYDEQKISLPTGDVYWNTLAPKPTTTRFVEEKGGLNDELHVVVYDVNGGVTGIPGNILEKHVGLSKANDTVSASDSPLRIYWKEYLATFSKYIFAGDNLSSVVDTMNGTTPTATGFSGGSTVYTLTQGLWNQPAYNVADSRGVVFSAIGNASYALQGGVDYDANLGFTVDLGDVLDGYELFNNKSEYPVDFLIMGPGLSDENETRAKASSLIAIAESRRDCIACISPHRDNVVNVTNSEDATNNVLKFFAPLPSTSYAVFDSGYKYTFDRFNNKFRYIPCNGDVAGIMVRSAIRAYPWFSPAGQQRGILNNAVKLAFSPNQSQRDRLYSKRINPIITQAGLGTLLFGDKTALGYASAFDRINVRRLFLTVEKALEDAANAQLFELNDDITRANFVNIVDPFLRDIRSKRGVYDYLVVCDESNNTPDIVDNNEFRADIYLKPAKSINYVTLTFVATRSGVSFSESVGTV